MAHFGLNKFIALTKKDGLIRPSHFSAVITKPKGFTEDWGPMDKFFSFCKIAAIPGVNFATYEHEEFGEIREDPVQKKFDNVSMTFLLDNELLLRKTFESWMNIIIDPVTRTHGYYDDFVTRVEIDIDDASSEAELKRRNKKSNTRMKIILHQAYPKSIEAIPLDYTISTFAEMVVSMNYKYYTIEKTE